MQKLNKQQRTQIRREYRETLVTTAELATRYNVHQSTISRCLRKGIPDKEYYRLVQKRLRLRGVDESRDREPLDLSLFGTPTAITVSPGRISFTWGEERDEVE
jgi:IS30 family transposase